jgi:uncharacterized protein YnzC (UPF0291/DUF896 family)
MTTDRDRREGTRLQNLKREFLEENVKLIKNGINAIKILQSEGNKGDVIRLLDEMQRHSDYAVKILDEIEKIEGTP